MFSCNQIQENITVSSPVFDYLMIGFGVCQVVVLVVSASDSVLKKFLDETANMSADERAKLLEGNKVR